MPNMDPATMKKMLARMGIKSTEVDAVRVVIEGQEKDLVIENPQVTRIEAQGTVSFQVVGDATEREKQAAAQEPVEITEDDIKMVMEKSGVADHDRAREALESTKGDIAEAILLLQKQ